MALLKTIPCGNTGFEMTYWHIGAIQQDIRNKGYQVTLFGFKDKAARLEGRDVVEARGVQVAMGDAYKPDLIRADLYPLIKNAEAWADATDDL